METTDNEFDEGYESGETAALTEVQEMLVDEGFDADEVEEMLTYYLTDHRKHPPGRAAGIKLRMKRYIRDEL